MMGHDGGNSLQLPKNNYSVVIREILIAHILIRFIDLPSRFFVLHTLPV